jgi:sortase A
MPITKRAITGALTLSFGTLWVVLIIFGISATNTSPTHNSSHVKFLPDFGASPAASITKSPALSKTIIGTLALPSAQIFALPITRGVDKSTLDTGMAGAYPWSGPGQHGVFGIAAHRIGAGGPFRYLDQVNVGDRLTVETTSKKFTYRVISTKIVSPTDTSVLNGPKDDSRIVLITCTPLKTFELRIVVTAELITDAK